MNAGTKKLIGFFGHHRKLIYTVGVLLGLGLFLYQIWSGVTSIVARNIFDLYDARLNAAFGFTILTLGFQLAAWFNLVSMRTKSIGVLGIIRGYVLSFIPRYIPGSIWGYMSRNEWMAKTGNIQYAATNALTGIELLSSLAAGLSLVWFKMLINLSYQRGMYITGGICFIVIAGWYLIRKSGRILKLIHLDNVIDCDILDELNIWRWILNVLLYIFCWLSVGAALLLLKEMLGVTGSLPILEDLLGLVSAYSLAWFIGFAIVFVPSGLGFREVSLSYFLTEWLWLESDISITLAVSIRVLYLLAELAWVILGLVLPKILLKKRQKHRHP